MLCQILMKIKVYGYDILTINEYTPRHPSDHFMLATSNYLFIDPKCVHIKIIRYLTSL